MKKMKFTNFLELQNFIRTYNSRSILEIGKYICWNNFNNSQHLKPEVWLKVNTRRNYAIRIILLASAGNQHRSNKISFDEFNNLIYAYFDWGEHTIAYPNILNIEAESIFNSIQDWEIKNSQKVKNSQLKLSEAFDIQVIRQHAAGFFLQRQIAFQNAGVGYSLSRIKRTIKFMEFLEKYSNQEFTEDFLNSTGLTPKIYFQQFLGCLGLFNLEHTKGFCKFSQFPPIDNEIQKRGINEDNLKLFIKQNSASFHSNFNTSFRSKVKEKLNNVDEFYKPFFYNFLLDTPFIQFDTDTFFLPDPFSFTESCWNQIENLVLKKWDKKRLGNSLSNSFEDYFENVLLPYIAPNFFEKIPVVANPKNTSDKRADFLIKLSNLYILVECKNSTMSLDTSTYFDPEGIAELWCRIHLASQQIASTITALNLKDKPVIPLVMTFYDHIGASEIFEAIINQTNYCSRMGFTIPPIIRSIHEFEHQTSDRSLNNWAESILNKHNGNLLIKPDNQGHNYQYLKDISAFE